MSQTQHTAQASWWQRMTGQWQALLGQAGSAPLPIRDGVHMAGGRQPFMGFDQTLVWVLVSVLLGHGVLRLHRLA
jgi:hypothetical protein